MRNWISGIVIVVLLVVAGYFIWQDIQLKKQLHQQDDTFNPAHNSPPVVETEPANPEGVSPFDKPNIDPEASQFKSIPNLDTVPITTVQFDTRVIDFGRINEGDIKKASFKVTNTGKIVLLITHAQPSCGCTIPTTPREPIQPGASNNIDVQFNSAGKKGQVLKTVTLTANTMPRETVLTIRATIIPPDR